MEEIFLGLAAIFILGTAAQWVAWRLRIPSILVLLMVGFLAGPVTGWIDPDWILGDFLFPVLSFSVAVILFEGGLSLNTNDFKRMGVAVLNLIGIGALINGAMISASAHFLLGLDWPLSALLGAILIVTGPTVVIPL